MRRAPGETFVDGTLGGGGHSEALLEAGAHVIGLDQDPEALDFAKEKRLHRFGDRFQPVRANFARAGRACWTIWMCRRWTACCWTWGCRRGNSIRRSAGFSFQREGPLDMRMDPDGPVTAADLVNTAPAGELVRIFREYGEEPNARRIAARIVSGRAARPFETTMQLALAVEEVVPRRGRIHPATRIFQALRIAVNREMEVLESVLGQAAARLRAGGPDGGDHLSLAGGPDGEGIFQAPLDGGTGPPGVAGAEAEPGLHFSRADPQAGHRER